MLRNINDYVKTGIFGKTKTIIALQVALLNEHEELQIAKCEITDLRVQKDLLKEKSIKYLEEIKTLQKDIKNKEKIIKELEANQKQDGEYLVRKVKPGRPKVKVQEMNLKQRHYAKGTVKQLKELEENRG